MPEYPSGIGYTVNVNKTIPTSILYGDKNIQHPFYVHWTNSNLSYIGHVKGVQSYTKKNPSLRPNEEVRNIMKSVGLPIDDIISEFGVTVPSLESFYKDAKKYDRVHHFTADKNLFAKAITYWQKTFQSHVPYANVVSDEEAIRLADQNKSPGFPENELYATKKLFILNETPFIKKTLDLIRQGRIHDLVVKLADKEEIRPMEKISEFKVRTFAPVPCEIHIAFLKYFNDIAQALQSLDPKVSHNCAGWSIWYGGWHELLKDMEKYDQFGEDDAEKWDGSMITEIREMVWEFFWSKFFLDPKERAEARLVYFTVMNPFIVTPDGYMFRLMFGGRFSGELLTLIENSLINLFIFSYCALKKGYDLSKFFEKISVYFMGDDIFRAQYAKGIYNLSAEELRAGYYECNVILHSGTKLQKSPEQCTFLSLTPLKRNGYWFFTPNISKTIFSLSLRSANSTDSEIMQKLCILYAYSYFSAHIDNVAKIKACCIEYAKEHSYDASVVKMFIGWDIENIARMFFPIRHTLAVNLNNQANKSFTFNSKMQHTIHERNPFTHRDISGKNKDRPQGIDLSGRGIPKKKVEPLVGKPENYKTVPKKDVVIKNPLHDPTVDKQVFDAYQADHNIRNGKGSQKDLAHFDPPSDSYPYNYMGPYRSDGKFVESEPLHKHTVKPVDGDDYNSKFHDVDYHTGKVLKQDIDSPFYDWADSNFLDRIKDSKSWASYLASGAIYASKSLRALRRLLFNKNYDETDIKLKIEQLKEKMPKHDALMKRIVKDAKKMHSGKKNMKKFKRKNKKSSKKYSKRKSYDHGVVFNKPNEKLARSSSNNKIRKFCNVFFRQYDYCNNRC